jgi:hypothetical protein
MDVVIGVMAVALISVVVKQESFIVSWKASDFEKPFGSLV